MEKGIGIVLDTFKKALKQKGLKIIYGTDAVAGAHGRNYEEFIVRVRDGGQDPMAALISATSLSAESLGLRDKIGSIAPGLDADIIAMDGDPLRDATAVRRVVFVMKGGKVFQNLARGTKTQ
jgi:imidazolonepropionase-like amidohydrolase